MNVNEDFKFRDDLKQDTVPIELLTGPYKGVVYRYTKVAVKEKEDDTALMQFDYDIYESGNHVQTQLRKDKTFENHIGLILNQLILEAVDNPQSEDANRKDNTEELVEE